MPFHTPRVAHYVATPTVFGTEWWAAPIWNAAFHRRARLPLEPLRPWSVDAFGAGVLGEAWGYKATSCFSILVD